MHNLIRAFVRHPVAPNLAMLVMILAGIWATGQLTRQLLPAFAINVVTVTVDWPGAAAEDVEASVTQPLEDALLGLDELRNVNSTSREGGAQVDLEYSLETDMGSAIDQVKDAVAQIRNLPASAEEPQITTLARNENVAVIAISGPALNQLRPLVKRYERELRARGLSRVTLFGLPEEEISIEVAPDKLSELGYSLEEIASRLREVSVDVPAGTVGGRDIARQLRSEDQARSIESFGQLPIFADENGLQISLNDIAEIKRKAKPDQALVSIGGRPTVEIAVSRAEAEDALSVAENLNDWLEITRADLPPNVDIEIYSEVWRTVDERIDLMINNATSGLVLVLIVLYIFLNGRVAVWVAVGIPVSILAALMALYLFGGSINIMTLFALIMTFGIIVDDAIVVGEEAVTRYQNGEGPAAAAENAAISMAAPVTAASLTTVAAFLPLVTIGGPTGSILFAIPLVVICVVLASLIECFVVLPGHLRHSLQSTSEHQPPKWRRNVDVAFNKFRDGWFKNAVQWSVNNRRTTLALGVAGIILIIGLLGGGRIGFSFFPQPDGTTITANVRFVSGSPPERVEKFLEEARIALLDAEAASGESFINLVVARQNEAGRGDKGSHVGQMTVELTKPDQRSWSNQEIIRQWRSRVVQPPGMEAFLIETSRGGVPGADIEVEFSNADAETMKQASLSLQESLRDFNGVNAIRDDLAYGKEQLIFELSPTGRAIGLSSQQLGSQLRATFQGDLVQIFQDQGDSVEVRVRLAETDRDSLRALENLPIVLPDGSNATLSNVANISYARGFDSLKHGKGLLAVRVSADVDPTVNNANTIRAQLSRSIMPEIADRFGVDWKYRGKAEEQKESVGDISLALPLSLMMIYIILAWVFGSYLWPVAVMSVIPFGLVGAIFGHWVMGFEVTMLSLFGIFGLSGIVINDSIILTMVFKQLRKEGMPAKEAAIEASGRRLRAVLLTSLTTIVGIMPLLFETALQAQFLKPMVISISFGLMFGTLIVLFLLPAFLTGLESLQVKANRISSDFKTRMPDPTDVIEASRTRFMTRLDPTATTKPGSKDG
ncbi:MAG: efflux RND transporter permease subunit [Gammaproteobacteria bacterium]|nr:efflux RND transporter permease subunit [Gammaproteobacteria bacterium]